MSFRPASNFKEYNGWTNYETWTWNMHFMDYVVETMLEAPRQFRDMDKDEMCEWLNDHTYELYHIGGVPTGGIHFTTYRLWSEEIDFVQLAEHIADAI